MILSPLYRQIIVGRILNNINVRYYTLTISHYNSNNNVIPISKRVVKLNPILNSTLKARHLVALASTLCKNYKNFIARRDEYVVSRFWFIIITKMIDLTSRRSDDSTSYFWRDRIPNKGSIEGVENDQISIFEVVKLLKYFSLIRLLDHSSPVSRLLDSIEWASHLFNSEFKEINFENNLPMSIDNNTPFFKRIFPSKPIEEVNDRVINLCNLSNSPSHLVKYEWMLDQTFNFYIPNEYLNHISSTLDFITALKAALMSNISDYILTNSDTNCYARLLMYIEMISCNVAINSPFFLNVISESLNRIKTQLSNHLSKNIDALNPRLIAFIANASGMAGNLSILDCLEKYLISDDGSPTQVALSLHPDHLENICYAFSRRRIIKKEIFSSLSTIVKYKFDDFSPVVTLNILFSFSRVNQVDSVGKYLIKKINNYTLEQLSGVTEKVLANAIQSLAGFHNDLETFNKLVDAITIKKRDSKGFENDKLIYQSVIKRLLERGVMQEPLDECQLYNKLVELVDYTSSKQSMS